MLYKARCVNCNEAVEIDACPNCNGGHLWRKTHKDLQEAATNHAYTFFQCDKCAYTFDTFIHGCGGETMAKYFLSPVGRVWYLAKNLLGSFITGGIALILAGFVADWLGIVLFFAIVLGFGIIEPVMVVMGRKNPFIMAK